MQHMQNETVFHWTIMMPPRLGWRWSWYPQLPDALKVYVYDSPCCRGVQASKLHCSSSEPQCPILDPGYWVWEG